MRSKQGAISLMAVALLAAACSGESSIVESLADPGRSEPVVTTTAPLEQSTGTTAPDYYAMFGEFVEVWNQAQATGSLAHLRRVVHTESLHLYGEDVCATHIQTLEPITPSFGLRWSEDSQYGFTSIELDGVMTSVLLADMQEMVLFDGGAFEPTWAYPSTGGGWDEWASPVGAKVLLDCGEPIEGRYPLILATMRRPSSEDVFGAQTVSLDAPEQWWIDVWVRNGECDVSVLDATTSEILVSHTVRYHTAAELEFAGLLSIAAEGDCRLVRAVTDPSLIEGDITDLLPNAASVWLVSLLEDENGAETWFPFVNSGELPQDISGWEIHIEGMPEPYVFADGSALGPVAEIRFHAGCGSDDDTNIHLCLPDGVFEYGSITLHDAAGQIVDGL